MILFLLLGPGAVWESNLVNLSGDVVGVEGATRPLLGEVAAAVVEAVSERAEAALRGVAALIVRKL